MNHVRVTARVVNDNTGIQIRIPVILIEQDGQCVVLKSLVQYFISNYKAKSLSWMAKLCQIVGMLLDYFAANHAYFDKPRGLFETFAQRVYSGTIGEDGRDPSGLFWSPKRTKTANQLLNALSEFSDTLHTELGTTQLNPWREATTYEQRLNWAAFMNKSQHCFLGHLDGYADATETAKQARDLRQRRTPTGDYGETKAFSDDRLMDLLFVGFVHPGKENCPDIVERYDWRGICITILMHWGGLRVCEPFHLWVHDVKADPFRPSDALVRVYHPIDGAAPKDFRGPDGRYLPNREAYLKAKHPGYRPRHKETGNRKAGWKNPAMTDTRQNFMQVLWFPTQDSGRLFQQAWKLYMYQRMRAKLGSDLHPFLFVSLHGAQKGEPYTIDAFRDAHARAMRRIGLVPAKLNGTTNHGHRHAWGQRNERAKVDPIVTQKGLHHRSIESQNVYKTLSISGITKILETATAALAAGQPLPMVPNFDALLLEGRKDQERHLKTRRK